jgi:hypothetical protein
MCVGMAILTESSMLDGGEIGEGLRHGLGFAEVTDADADETEEPLRAMIDTFAERECDCG